MARTAKQRAALRKAQLASARKRRGKGKGKLAKANRSVTRSRRAAIVSATGGLALAAIGVAGAYYSQRGRKKKGNTFGSYSGSTVVSSSSPELNRAMRTARRTGAPRSNSLKAVGYAFDTQNRWSIKPPKPAKARRGAPRSRGARANSARTNFAVRNMALNDSRRGHTSRNHPLVTGITGLARHRMADKANRKRGLDGYIPSKAKFDRRRTKAQRKKYPRV